MKTKLNDLFDNLEPEKGNSLDNKIQIDDSIKEEFYKLVNKFKEVDISEVGPNAVSESFDKLNLKKYSSKEITQFSALMTEEIIFPLYGDTFGLLFNELIQRSQDQNHLLELQQCSNLWYVGHRNTKNIIINGNVESNLGDHMNYGKIVLNGNAKNFLGYKMRGGVIEVYGNVDSLSIFIKGGDIYHKNKQIVENGKILDRSYIKW